MSTAGLKEPNEAVKELVEQLAAKTQRELVDTAQRTIELVESGQAAQVGLEFSAALDAVLGMLILDVIHKGTLNTFGVNETKLGKLVRLKEKLVHGHRQAAAWAYRVANPTMQGVGRNLNKVEARILKRVSSTADKNWDTPL